MKTKPNFPELLQTIKSEKWRLDMDSYISGDINRFDLERGIEPTCNTTACIAGHAFLLWPEVYRETVSDGLPADTIFARMMKITDSQADIICHYNGWPSRFRRDWTDREGAIALITEIVDRGLSEALEK